MGVYKNDMAMEKKTIMCFSAALYRRYLQIINGNNENLENAIDRREAKGKERTI